ncbi:hypothetical protein BGX33_010540 [Mortierella sp. NVP41]|nr:hypothetical protein BGX33_010540 [Mortierella sp. NVP41]
MQPTTLDEDEDASAPNNDAYWNMATEFEGLKSMRLHNKPARDENALPFYIASGSTRNQFRPIFASKDTILGSSSRELDIRQSEAKDLSDPKPPRKPKKQPRADADKSKRDKKKEEDKKDSTKQKSAKKKKVVWKKGTSVEPGQKLHLKHATRVDRAYRRNQVTKTLLVGSVKVNVLRALAAGLGANDNSGSGPGIETGAEPGVEAEGSGSGSGSGGLAFGGDAEGEFDDPEGGDDEPGDDGDKPGDDGEIDVSSMSLEDKALAVSNRISRTVTVLNQLRAHLYELLILDMESILSARFGQVGNTPEASASSSPLSIQDLNDLKISSRTTHSTRPWWLFSLLAGANWMHLNWPNKTIKGLESKREWAGDAEDGLAVKAEHDLAQCAGVCHAWNALFTPHLWRTVRIMEESAFEYFNNPVTLSAFVRNSQHIRVFETIYANVVKYVSRQSCLPLRLQSLVLNFIGTVHPLSVPVKDAKDATFTTPFGTADVLITLLQQNPGLRSLALGGHFFRDHKGNNIIGEVMKACPRTMLSKLDISHDFCNLGEHEDAADEPLVLDMQVSPSRISPNDLSPFTALRELRLANRLCSMCGGMDFLRRCQNLERIELDYIFGITLSYLSGVLRTHCHQLTHLDWTSCGEESEEDCVHLMKSSRSGWKVLRLTHMDNFGPLAFGALMESASTLEELQMDWAQCPTSENTMRLLCSATQLRHLGGHSDHIFSSTGDPFYTAGLELHAYDAYIGGSTNGSAGRRRGRPWAIGESMRYLRLMIHGVPRPDVVHGGDEYDLGMYGYIQRLDSTMRFEVQKWIYKQLSALTGLQELILGMTDDCLDPARTMYVDDQGFGLTFNFHCLELSLESGLELLKGLKDLRVLDVRSIAHRIGVDELEWIHVHWPKLKTIRGLTSSGRYWADETVNGALETAAVDAWVCHDWHAFFEPSLWRSVIPTREHRFRSPELMAALNRNLCHIRHLETTDLEQEYDRAVQQQQRLVPLVALRDLVVCADDNHIEQSRLAFLNSG